jgi:sugar lactone lactonase YvrE
VAADVTRLAAGFSFLESPRWHDGLLYVSDFYSHRVLRTPDGREFETVCEVDGQPSGLGFDRQGRLLVVSMTDRRLLRLDDSGLTEVADLAGLASYHCNDMVVDDRGRAYIGNFGSDVDNAGIAPACLILVEPDGRARPVAGDLVFPNGMAITPDGLTLLVAETFAYRITAFTIGPDGSLHSRRVWAPLADGSVPLPRALAQVLAAGQVTPDGICLDADGALWVADATGNGAIRIGESGARLDYVPTGPDAVYAVALGGADSRTLFMCAAPPLGQSDPVRERRGSLLCCRVDVPAARGVT